MYPREVSTLTVFISLHSPDVAFKTDARVMCPFSVVYFNRPRSKKQAIIGLFLNAITIVID